MGRERYGGGLHKGVMGRLEGLLVVMLVSLEHMEFYGHLDILRLSLLLPVTMDLTLYSLSQPSTTMPSASAPLALPVIRHPRY